MDLALRSHVQFEFSRILARHDIMPTHQAQGMCAMRLGQTLRAAIDGKHDTQSFAEAVDDLNPEGILSHKVVVCGEAIKITTKKGVSSNFNVCAMLFRVNGLTDKQLIIGDSNLGRDMAASDIIFFSYSLESAPYDNLGKTGPRKSGSWECRSQVVSREPSGRHDTGEWCLKVGVEPHCHALIISFLHSAKCLLQYPIKTESSI
jgi:hypothetical protein